MKTLYLMRHADATPAQNAGSDHARSLSDFGKTQTTAMHDYLAGQPNAPQVILASDARRTLMTADIVSNGQKIIHCPPLYSAVVDTFLEEIAKIDDSHDSLLIVAHNPGIAELAVYLSGNHPDASHFPPATLARFTVNAAHWHECDKPVCTFEEIKQV